MKILVLVAHPDDEVLGCGGTIYRLSEEGHKVFIAFAADGVSGRQNHKDNEILLRQKSAQRASKQIKAKILTEFSYSFPDQKLDGVDFNKIVQWIEKIGLKIKPEMVFTHFSGDLNRDHRIIGEAVMVAFRPFSSAVKKIYAMEIPETTQEGHYLGDNLFNPNTYFAVSKAVKMKLLKHYQTETKRSNKWARGVAVLGGYRGFNANLDFAEAFILLRKIDGKN